MILGSLSASHHVWETTAWASKLVDFLYEANREVKAQGRCPSEDEMVSWNRRFDRLIK
jgi:hypothetical protein